MKNELKIYEISTRGPVLYIRHAQTNYNEAMLTIPKELLRDKPNFIDCQLSDEGIKQAEELSDKLKEFRIKYVFCSPLMRCLQTALISLQNHRDSKDFSVIISPLINEIVSGVHDFSKDIKSKQEMFNENSLVKFNWDCFNSLYHNEEERELYFLEFVDNYSNEEIELKNIWERLINLSRNKYDVLKNADEYKENNGIQMDRHDNKIFSKYELLLAEFSGYFVEKKKRPETLKSMFNRNLKFKYYLKHFLNNLSENEKIIVITHSAFSKISTSKKVYEMETIPDFPSDCYKLSNCEIITMNI